MGRPSSFTDKERHEIFSLYLDGFEYKEIAVKLGTYRQKIRSVVEKYKPSPKQIAIHSENKAIKKLTKKI